jgi:hypothetical protein
MTNALIQAVSISGAACVLVAYAMQRFKYLEAERAPYLLLNFAGGALLCFAAVVTGQIGFIILEGAWTLISLIGLFNLGRAR